MSATRECLPDRRPIWTQKFRVGNQSGHFTIGFYPDGRPAEIFIDLNKAGSAVRAWASAASLLLSLGLQYRVPLDELVDALEGLNSEPFGSVPVTGYPRITSSAGVLDFIVRVLGLEFLGREDLADVPTEPEKPGFVADFTTKGSGR